MKRYYSPQTMTSYLQGIHSVIPEDAVEISEELYLSVIASPPPGKVRSHDAGGLPCLIDLPAPVVDSAALERTWRDTQIAAVQWLRDRHRDEQDMQRETTLTAEQFAELLAYLQALRDWPQSEFFPDIEHRPVVPGWVAEQTQ